jgi:transposase
MDQISVLTAPERRRRWSEHERCRIVAAAFAQGSCAAQVARDHDISTGLISTWRRRLRQDLAEQVIVVGLTGLGPDILPLRVDGPP